MRLVTCLLLALGAGLAGLSLRLFVPVTPVDETFREVVRLYLPKDAGPGSNMPETSAP
ncbi:hypothetical protein [Methylorubrum salsuginis]|uniref:Uncharacterized protein n=1 Tax=Methylorubrum salsuginis TaxID=414703 RepID=A0A1I4JR28_9HYPH|nr:hypothetical protein [Methylorubrum salsuginis]SFL68667.1 hypothetical protein SAMN04488125_12116 [Methylorubrum salsuginis]